MAAVSVNIAGDAWVRCSVMQRRACASGQRIAVAERAVLFVIGLAFLGLRAGVELGHGTVAHAAAVEGQVVAFFTMVVAACEVVVGLAIIVTIYRSRRSASVDDASLLKR